MLYWLGRAVGNKGMCMLHKRQAGLQVDSTALPDGSVLIAYNDDTESRSGLTLARTWDGGVSWEKVLVLEDDPLGSFSYPTIQYDPMEVRELYLRPHAVSD